MFKLMVDGAIVGEFSSLEEAQSYCALPTEGFRSPLWNGYPAAGLDAEIVEGETPISKRDRGSCWKWYRP